MATTNNQLMGSDFAGSNLSANVYFTLESYTRDAIPSGIERYIEAVILGMICAVSLFGNISLWCVVCSNRSLRSTSNALVLCLSMADILVSALNMPITVYTIITGRWTLSENACQTFGFISMVTFIASVMFLGVISINRYYLICQPHRFRKIYSKVNTACFIVGTWAFSVTLALPPLFGWGKYAYLPNQSFCFCDWKTNIPYTFFMVGICFGGPCTVMSVCYVMIMKEVRASRQRIAAMASTADTIKHNVHGGQSMAGTNVRGRESKNMVPEVTVMCVSSEWQSKEDTSHSEKAKRNGGITLKVSNKRLALKVNQSGRCAGDAEWSSRAVSANESSEKKLMNIKPFVKTCNSSDRTKENIRLAISFLLVIFLFVLSWLPFCITMFLSVFLPNPIPRIPDMITLLLGCLNSVCNPIIYGLMNKRFRDGFKNLYTLPYRRWRAKKF